MSKDLKESWKETGKELGFAFRDLGKTLIKTGTFALKKADEWANREEGGAPGAQKKSTSDGCGVGNAQGSERKE